MEQYEQAKARMRAKVEHPFHVVKNLFRHRKTHCRGLVKNAAQLFSLFGLAIWSWRAGVCWRSTPEVRLDNGQRMRLRYKPPLQRASTSNFQAFWNAALYSPLRR